MKSFGAMNLSLNDESGEFILCGAQQSRKGKLKYVPWVIFYCNVWQGVLVLIIDVGYEVESLYDNITNDSVDGRELFFRYGLSGSPMRAIGLIEE